MNDLYGIPVLTIRPGDQWHPGDGKIYFINLLEMRKITDRVFNRPYDPIDYKVPFKLEKYQIGYFSRIDISG